MRQLLLPAGTIAALARRGAFCDIFLIAINDICVTDLPGGGELGYNPSV
jgi:hypothetical protein